jgi:hypothetical protein
MKHKMPIWLTEQGEKVACVEKIKVMQENLEELYQMAQDTFEDGILMGIDHKQLKSFILDLVNKIHTPYLAKE